MKLASLDGLWWLLLMLGPLLLIQPRLHLEIQAVFLILTRRPALSIGLFSLLFFPGVFLHEGSHFLAARLMGVRTGRISLIPQPLPGGKLRLGFVETASTDIVRDALIGFAPLLTGGCAVALIGILRLGLLPVGEALFNQQWQAMGQLLVNLPQQPDFWVWFYLAFTISSTMLPSAADRRGWLPVILALVLLFAMAVLFGAGPWLITHLATPFNLVLRAVAGVFAISLATNTLAWLPVWALHRILSRITGMEVN